MKKIPCLDLQKQHQQIKSELLAMFEKVIDGATFSGGSFIEEFEKTYSRYINVKHTVAVNNGTTALQLALLALNIGNGDEVILPANTFIATAFAITHTGAIPVFVDCTADTWEIDASRIEEKITSKTKAVIGVHLYGQPFDIDAVALICKTNNLFLIEDAAQAQGALYNGKRVGGFGDIACFSFYPTKNLGACGEAGAICINDEKYIDYLQSLRNQGMTIRYYHNEIGYNCRMGALEAASLTVKLKFIEGWNNRRREIAQRYQTEIKNKKIVLQKQADFATSVFYLFVITTENKDAFCKYLNDNNIIPAFHYPVPCHLQKAYSNLGYKTGDFPNSEYLASHCVSLPMYPELTEEEIDHVIQIVNRY